jgi:mono/diheme cytochrome c family protein
MRRAFIVWAGVMLAGCAREPAARDAAPAQGYGLGRAATPQEITQLDIDVGPDGEGLPAGSGTTQQGEALYQQKCAICHGAKGEGTPPANPPLIGRDPKGENFMFATDPKIVRTIGNYWPNATTVFDYVRRAMPLPAPGSLTNDEVYALTAYLLAANQVIPVGTSLDAQALKQVKMPYAGRFVRADSRR